MRKLVTALVLAFACSIAFAGGAQQESNVDVGNAADAANNNAQSITFNQPASDGTIDYRGGYELDNVPNVSAPGLTTTLSETCMGSTSGGAAASGWGVSFGTTWRDIACVRRLDARQMQSLGYALAAKERMCDDPKNAAALKRAGKPCYNDLPDEKKRPEDRAAAQPKAAKVSYSNDTDQEQSGWSAYQALTGN